MLLHQGLQRCGAVRPSQIAQHHQAARGPQLPQGGPQHLALVEMVQQAVADQQLEGWLESLRQGLKGGVLQRQTLQQEAQQGPAVRLGLLPPEGRLQHGGGSIDRQHRQGGQSLGQAKADVARSAAQIDGPPRSQAAEVQPLQDGLQEGLVAAREISLGIGEGLLGLVHQLGFWNALHCRAESITTDSIRPGPRRQSSEQPAIPEAAPAGDPATGAR